MLTDHSLTITVLNVRSFPKHAIAISHSDMLLQTDVFCFTETQLLLNREITYTISENLDQFNFLRNSCNDQVFPFATEIELVFLKTAMQLDDPYYHSQNAAFRLILSSFSFCIENTLD